MAAKKNDKTVMPSVKDLRAMSTDDLRKALQEQREGLMQARFKHVTAQLEKTSDLRAMRRQIARIETILTENEQRA